MTKGSFMDASEMRTALEQHHKESFGWALNCCRRNQHQAEEVLQTVYLKILEGKARFDGMSGFKTWIFSVIRKTAADERRKMFFRRLTFTPYEENSHTGDDASADETVSRSETQIQFLRALDSLPARQREVLHLVFYQDLTLSNAAQVLGISIGSTRTHYERGKKRIRQLMEEPNVFEKPQSTGRKRPGIIPTAETGR